MRVCGVRLSRYVPKSRKIAGQDLDQFSSFLQRNNKLFCLTGAGISTESGIPDYRSKGVGLYDRKNHKPIEHHEFVKSEFHRQRYWARNFVGYQYFSVRTPNETHFAINDLMKRQKIETLVTQNVDGLHIKAGSKNLVELHGSTHRSACLNCKHIISRAKMQTFMNKANESWDRPIVAATSMAPDADAELTQDQINGFSIVPCPKCGGIIKPDVTFFGDNVNVNLVKHCYNKVAENDGVLVIGSSLFVWSGFRFVREAITLGKDVFIINIGETRADKFAEKQELNEDKYCRLEVQASQLLKYFKHSDSL